MVLFEDAKTIPPVSKQAAAQYEEKQIELLAYVNQTLSRRADIDCLIGHNNLQVMVRNHMAHMQFMIVVFQLGSYELLSRVVVWVYRAYKAQGFSYSYFPAQIDAWKQAINLLMEPEPAAEVLTVYDWLSNKHSEIQALAEDDNYQIFPELVEWRDTQTEFLSHLITGEYKQCVSLSEKNIQDARDLNRFYMDVVQPCMYRIGNLWENGKLSVAQEHLATAIITRVMLTQYIRLPGLLPTKGRAVIASAPNELHELGSRMAADLLELDGWEVFYLGANTPAEDLVAMVGQVKPIFVGIGVVMPSNLVGVSKIIERIREDADIAKTKVIVGGASFYYDHVAWQRIGADGVAYSCQDVLNFAAAFSKGTDS